MGENPSVHSERNMALWDKVAGEDDCPIILCGAGPLGKRALRGLRQLGIHPIAWADNNPHLSGQVVEGMPVVRTEAAALNFRDRAIFVATIFNPSALVGQLTGLGCLRVVPYTTLFWKYPETFLPYGGIQLPETIREQSQQILKAFELWDDEVSRQEFVAQLKWRQTMDSKQLPPQSPVVETYFPSDLVEVTKDETFIDCGAFDGDSMRNFLSLTGNSFRKIIPLEPDPSNCAKLRQSIASLPLDVGAKIQVHNVAVGARREKVQFSANGDAGSGISSSGILEVDCATLDEILQEACASYVKMDIEGAEPGALSGARKLIGSATAVWAICLYHEGNHLWELPLFFKAHSDGYRYYLRRYAEDCWELVLYAIPHSRCL